MEAEIVEAITEGYESHVQTYAEEIINTITHLVLLLLSIPATILLVSMARVHGNKWHVTGCALYGFSLILVYTCSTLYHASGICELTKPLQGFLRNLDHCAIYFLIAGTYTPLTLINLVHDNLRHPPVVNKAKVHQQDKNAARLGMLVLAIVWSICVIGVSSKLMLGVDGGNQIISYGSYLVMGWLVVLVARPYLKVLPRIGLRLLVAGGVSYTTGVIFLLSDSLPFNHPVWHLFVSAGSILHYFCVIACSIPIESSPWTAMEKRTKSRIIEGATRFASYNLVG